MKILNISSIIPLKGLKRENDIILRVQDFLKEEYDYEFIIAKSLPFTPFLLPKVNRKWERYRDYINTNTIEVQGYKTVIYSWLMLPTSDLWINYLLIPLNWIWYKLFIRHEISQHAKESDLVLSQNLIPDALIAYWVSKYYGKPYILNFRGDIKKSWQQLPLTRSIIEESQKIITPSPTLYNSLKKNNDINLIAYPIDKKFYINYQEEES